MATSFNFPLVLLSIVVAMIAAHVSVDLASRVRSAVAGQRRDWLIAGAMVLGIGIWTMHFVGMLALQAPLELGYSLGTTLASMLPAIAAAACALQLIQRPHLGARQLWLGGLVMGGGIGAMHYMGMAAITLSPAMQYASGWVVVSLLFGVSGSTLVLWLAHRTYAATSRAQRVRRSWLSAAVGGLMIAGTHYLGMAAVRIDANSICLSGYRGASVPHVYQPWLVALSVTIAVLAAYTALDVAARLRTAQGRLWRLWLIGGGFAMGLGIWSMHFIGMIALDMGRPVRYDLPLTLLSSLPAFAASGFALFMIQRGEISPRILGLSGVLMGSGIGAMHYIGMAALQMAQPLRYDATFFSLSILVAIAASVAALWIGLQDHGGDAAHEIGLRRVGSALVMGLAIAGMHYTGMSASHVMPEPTPGSGAPAGLDPNHVAVFVGVATLLVLLLTYVVAFYDGRLAVARKRFAEQVMQASEQLQLRAAELAENMTADLRAAGARDRLQASIVEQSGEAIITLDSSNVVQSWNRAAQTLFGYNREQMLGRRSDQIDPQDKEARLAQLLSHRLHGDEMHRFATTLISPSGQRKHVSSSVAPHRDAHGNLVGTIAIVRDITREVDSEEALRREKRRAEVTVQAIADAVIVVGATGLVEYINPAAERLLGVDAAVAENQAFATLVPLRLHTSAIALDDLLARCLGREAAVPVPYGTELVGATGLGVHVAGTLAPILDLLGAPTGAVMILSAQSSDETKS